MQDALQLCGQAMCLEEMLCCEIPSGRAVLRRSRASGKEVEFTPELRRRGAHDRLREMHELYRRGSTPEGEADESLQCLFAEGTVSSKADAETDPSQTYLRRAMSSEAEEGKP